MVPPVSATVVESVCRVMVGLLVTTGHSCSPDSGVSTRTPQNAAMLSG